jgi:hypothetical protein
MTALWLATVAVPSTAFAWTLFAAPKAGAPAPAASATPAPSSSADAFRAGGRVYAAVEALLRERGHLV